MRSVNSGGVFINLKFKLVKKILTILLFFSISFVHGQDDANSSGKYYSTIREFNDEGVLISEINYVNGKPIGEYKYYYDDGTLMEQGVWNLSHQVGTLKRFDEQGNILQFFKFDESGDRLGNQFYYYQSGAIRTTKLIFENDSPSKIIRYTLDGKQKSFITL